jgi:hypothetical protein
MAEEQPDVRTGGAQEQTLNLLRDLGFARTDEQVDAYKRQIEANADQHTPEYWEQLRTRLGVNTDRAA